MKFRIIGTIIVLAILGALFVVMQDPGAQQAYPNQPTQPSSEPALQPLKIQ